VTDIASLLSALGGAGVDFIIVGGVAATIHGSSRLTQDIDVVYERSDANLEPLAAALGGVSPYLRGAPRGLPFEWSARTLRQGLNFRLTTTLGDIDLLGEITGGGDYETLAPHAVEVSLFGSTYRCLDLEGLIRTKRAAGRGRDLEAIAELEGLREESDGLSRND
jgi:predicted nucleotidyltransferase